MAHIDGLCAFGPDRGAAPEVDPEIQPLQQERAEGDHDQHGRDPQGHAPAAEEIPLGLFRDKAQGTALQHGFGAFALVPDDDHQAGHEDRGKDRGDDAEAKGDGKSAHRAGPHRIKDERGDEGGDIGVGDGTQGLFIAQFDSARRSLGGLDLFADPFKDQHVRVHRHPDGQDNARDPRQGQRGAYEAQQAKDQPDIDDKRDIGENPESAVAEEHEDQHQREGHDTGDLARLDTVCAELRPDGPLFEELKPGRQGPRAQQNRQIGGFFDSEPARNDAGPARDMALDHRRANDLVIQHDGERIANICGGVITELTRARWVEPERHRRPPVLIEIRLRIDQFLAGHNRPLFEDVIDAFIVKRWQDFVARTGGFGGIRRAAHHRLEGQLRGGADNVLQLRGTSHARHLDQDTVRTLPLDRGFAGADLVDPAADDFQRLAHGTLVSGKLLGLAKADDDAITLGGNVDIACPHAGQRGDRPCQPAHQRGGFFDLIGIFHKPDAQFRALGRLQADRANGGTLLAQQITHLGPHALDPRLIDIRNLHLGQQMGPAPQIKPEIDQPRGHPTGPKRDIVGQVGIGLSGLYRDDRVIMGLDPCIEPIRQGHQQTKGHHAPDHNAFPQVDLKHYPAFSTICCAILNLINRPVQFSTGPARSCCAPAAP